jgi:hypothetical protein
MMSAANARLDSWSWGRTSRTKVLAIIADNADYCPAFLARVRAPGHGYMSVPFASDVELTMRIG